MLYCPKTTCQHGSKSSTWQQWNSGSSRLNMKTLSNVPSAAPTGKYLHWPWGQQRSPLEPFGGLRTGVKRRADTPRMAVLLSCSLQRVKRGRASLFWSCSCTRDWNENKAEWLLSDVWYTTCNGTFPERRLHMAPYSPPDLDPTVSENNFQFEPGCRSAVGGVRSRWK